MILRQWTHIILYKIYVEDFTVFIWWHYSAPLFLSSFHGYSNICSPWFIHPYLTRHLQEVCTQLWSPRKLSYKTKHAHLIIGYENQVLLKRLTHGNFRRWNISKSHWENSWKRKSDIFLVLTRYHTRSSTNFRKEM